MTTVDELKLHIDDSIRLNESFAVFRLPGETRINYICRDSGKISVYRDTQSLNKESGFVIAPFCISKDLPVVLIGGEPKILDIDLETSFPVDHSCTKEYTPVSPDYEQRFETFIHALRKKKPDKLVLSRYIKYKRGASFSPVIAFLKACKRYTGFYVYLCHTPRTGTWLGGTPEIILSGEMENLHTVALAGTQRIRDNILPPVWDNKNIKEQRYVADYIHEQLQAFGIEAKEEGPYTARAGELAHLKSDFRFSLPDNSRFGDLLKLLHPTPAVCGFPKEDAYRFILENEGYNRKYYSGFIGLLNSAGVSNIYVNLRCMNIEDEYLTLYAGGGLLSSSTLSEEWEETEDKLYTMKEILKNN